MSTLIKCNGLVLRLTKYSESGLILKCYTQQFGLQSYFIPGVAGKKASVKPSQLLPLTLLEFESYQHSHKSLNRIKELKCSPVFTTIHTDILKTSLILFFSEVLLRTITEENHPDEELYLFLNNLLVQLDKSVSQQPNLPCYFMIQISKYLGFELQEDTYSHLFHEGQIIQTLSQSSFSEQSDIPIEKSLRNQLMNLIIHHYQIHITGFNQLKTLQVLKTVLE